MKGRLGCVYEPESQKERQRQKQNLKKLPEAPPHIGGLLNLFIHTLYILTNYVFTF